MPTLNLKTNVKTVPAGIHTRLVDLMVEMFSKDRKYMCTMIESGQDMMFGGTDEPCALIQVACIAGVRPELNVDYSRRLCELMSKEFGVPNNRLYIIFSDPTAENVGHLGSIFSVLAKK